MTFAADAPRKQTTGFDTGANAALPSPPEARKDRECLKHMRQGYDVQATNAKGEPRRPAVATCQKKRHRHAEKNAGRGKCQKSFHNPPPFAEPIRTDAVGDVRRLPGRLVRGYVLGPSFFFMK
jgi:hypothetical protein